MECEYKKGDKKCKYKRKEGEFCGIHKKIVENSIKNMEMKIVQENENDQSLLSLKDRILLLDTTLENKKHILKHLKNTIRLEPHTTEYYKNYIYIENCIHIPWGVYKSLKGEKKDTLINVGKCLDKMVYGMDTTKQEIMNYAARMLTNPNSTRNILGLYGLAGSGKTRIVHAIAKALNRDIKTISLGGVKDVSYFLGHGYIYVESGPGAIIQSLIDTKCMNPIIYFDELDKVSETSGKDVYSFLTYLTDAMQNMYFREHYFNGIQFDLSKIFFVFTFNDISKIDNILLDRINLINIHPPTKEEKINILYNFCLPDIIKNIGLDDIPFLTRNNIKTLVNDSESIFIKVVESTGIRELYRVIENILMEYNKSKILDDNYIFDFDVVYKTIKTRNIVVDDFMSMYM